MPTLERFNNSPNEEFLALLSDKDATGLIISLTSTELQPGNTLEWISSQPNAFSVIATNGTAATVKYGPGVGAGNLSAILRNASGNVLKTFAYPDTIVVNHALPITQSISDIIRVEE